MPSASAPLACACCCTRPTAPSMTALTARVARRRSRSSRSASVSAARRAATTARASCLRCSVSARAADWRPSSSAVSACAARWRKACVCIRCVLSISLITTADLPLPSMSRGSGAYLRASSSERPRRWSATMATWHLSLRAMTMWCALSKHSAWVQCHGALRAVCSFERSGSSYLLMSRSDIVWPSETCIATEISPTW